ncbi:hypothetical protein JVU11DRAFT_9011 [Chiua virens]|nr:hypothetical protein JVU11DRAFT_9011 [Chiua virens]
MSAPCVLPVELIIRILCYLEPRDMIQWRTVSHGFYAISYDTSLWKSLYKNAAFLCPPGPYPSQSIASLERTLVKSARLAQSWTTRPMRRVSLVEIPTGNLRPPLKLICGRWLIVCHKAREFVLYDTDFGCKTHAPQVLWKCEKQRVRGFDVESMVSAEGQCIVYVLVGFMNLLEFRLNGDTGELYSSAAMDPHVSRSVLVRPCRQFGAGQSRFLFIPATPETLVFDTETKTFYELPPLHVALDENSAELTRQGTGELTSCIQMAFTESHLISIHYFGEGRAINLTVLIQVFTFHPVDIPGQTRKGFFRLTHEGLFQTRFLMNIKVMKPCIDPVTGTTTIRLLSPSVCYSQSTIACVDLVLLEASSDKLLPITISWREIGLPNLESIQYPHQPHICLDTSHDGAIARGFFRATFPGQDQTRRESQVRGIMKFELDTTLNQEPRIIHSEFQQPEWSIDDEPNTDNQPSWSHSPDDTHSSAMLDGTRGKLCYLVYASDASVPSESHRLVVHVAHIE